MAEINKPAPKPTLRQRFAPAFSNGVRKLGDLSVSAVRLAAPAVQERFASEVQARTGVTIGGKPAEIIDATRAQLASPKTSVATIEQVAISAARAGVNPANILTAMNDADLARELADLTTRLQRVYDETHAVLDAKSEKAFQIDKATEAKTMYIANAISRVKKRFGIHSLKQMEDLHHDLKVLVNLDEASLVMAYNRNSAE